MLAKLRRPLAASLFGSAVAFAGLALSTTPAEAQVSGAVVINSGPVRGRIAVGEPVFAPRTVVIYQPVRGRRVAVARYAPQVVVVERGHGRDGRPGRWYRRHGYRPVTLYFANGQYFAPVYAARGYRADRQFIPVVVWERDGRFFVPSGEAPDRYGYTSRDDRYSSHGSDFRYEDDHPHGDGRDWDD